MQPYIIKTGQWKGHSVGTPLCQACKKNGLNKYHPFPNKPSASIIPQMSVKGILSGAFGFFGKTFLFAVVFFLLSGGNGKDATLVWLMIMVLMFLQKISKSNSNTPKTSQPKKKKDEEYPVEDYT